MFHHNADAYSGGKTMLHLLTDKKVIFFDVGYTLDMPASGDWMFTNSFFGRNLRPTEDAQQR